MEKTFQINYKVRYGETSEWGQEHLKATNKKQALNIFAKKMKIPTKEFKSFEDWRWDEGVWLAGFKSIKQVKEKKCIHCGGTGIIHI